MEYWWRRVEETSSKWTQLRDLCRSSAVEVLYTVIQSLTADGRDQSLDYKISGFHVPPGSFDAEVTPPSSLHALLCPRSAPTCSTGRHAKMSSCDTDCMQVLACIAPGPDEIVLPKTSSSVFCSTNIDYILRR